jgi:spore coat polysaccharide biosynthesis predicted glycosyltransferase SpsG/L-amino acid N-acyltransferase YncA
VSSLVIRADGGPGIGSGHLGRSLALAQAWRDGGGEVTLVSAQTPQAWARRYEEEGIVVLAPADGWEGDGADWVVLDGYSFTVLDQRQLKEAGSRLAVIDDHGAGGKYLADVIVDQNLGASAAMYADRPAGSALLLGPAFALLRREFRRPPVTIRDVGSRVLVLVGGSPPESAVALVERALERMPWATVVRPRDESHVAEAMAQADLAISGAGVTTWELCAMGLPAVLLVVADNQAPVAAAVSDAGAAVSLGDSSAVTPDELAAAATRLLASGDARAALAIVQRRLVDGRGARRVAARLRAALVTLRDPNAEDAALLWEWANEEAVRRLSFSPEPISWEDHVKWLEERIVDPATYMYVAVDDSGLGIGQISFDLLGPSAEIDVSVAPAQRGKGLGAAIIAAGVARFFGEVSARRVVARVRPENVASVEAFTTAGFVLEGTESDDAYTWLRYSRERDDAEA